MIAVGVERSARSAPASRRRSELRRERIARDREASVARVGIVGLTRRAARQARATERPPQRRGDSEPIADDRAKSDDAPSLPAPLSRSLLITPPRRRGVLHPHRRDPHEFAVGLFAADVVVARLAGRRVADRSTSASDLVLAIRTAAAISTSSLTSVTLANGAVPTSLSRKRRRLRGRELVAEHVRLAVGRAAVVGDDVVGRCRRCAVP